MHKSFAKRLAVVASMLCVSASSMALNFTFTFVDGFNDSYGSLTSTNIGGDEFAITGSLTVTMGADMGTYSLVANANAPGISNNGIWLWNDKLYLGGPPYLDSYGLLFTDGGSKTINIYNNGGVGLDQHYAYNNGFYSGPPTGTFTLNGGGNAVPEPFTIGLGVAAAGVFVRRRIKAKSA